MKQFKIINNKTLICFIIIVEVLCENRFFIHYQIGFFRNILFDLDLEVVNYLGNVPILAFDYFRN